MRGAILLLASLLALPVMFSGCVADCTRGPMISARGITDAPAEAGDGDAVVTLTVTHGAGGPPVPGAGVVFYWADNRVDHYQDEAIPPEAGEPRDPVEPGKTAATPAPKRTLTLSTGQDGQVRAHLPEGHIVGVVAAKEGFTEEWIGYFPATGDATSALSLPLYRQHITVPVNGTLSPAAASTGTVTGNNRAWSPQPIDLGPDPAGQMARLVRLEARLTWENTPTAFGDLGIGVGPQSGDPPIYHDEDDNAAIGPQEEVLELLRNDVEAYGLHEAQSLHVGPATDSGYLAPQGLDYALALELSFDRVRSDLDGCLYVLPPPESDDRSGGPGASIDGAETPWLGPAAALTTVALLAAALSRRT